MVPCHRPAAGAPARLTRPTTPERSIWEGASLTAVLDRFEGRLGPLVSADVVGLGIATVDLERAAADLTDLTFDPAPHEALVGARSLVALLPSGRQLVLLEPDREGRLTAFLARHGEGLAVVYVVGRNVPQDARSGRTAIGALGWLVSGEQAYDPVIVLVAWPSVAAGTIAT